MAQPAKHQATLISTVTFKKPQPPSFPKKQIANSSQWPSRSGELRPRTEACRVVYLQMPCSLRGRDSGVKAAGEVQKSNATHPLSLARSTSDRLRNCRDRWGGGGGLYAPLVYTADTPEHEILLEIHWSELRTTVVIIFTRVSLACLIAW